MITEVAGALCQRPRPASPVKFGEPRWVYEEGVRTTFPQIRGQGHAYRYQEVLLIGTLVLEIRDFMVNIVVQSEYLRLS